MAEPFDDPLDDQPLVRSLRAPGTPGELADQDRYLAMFREVRAGGSATATPGSPRRPRGRAARRLGAGTTLSIAIAVAGGGVAAAYTASLPEPLQQFAHDVLAPVHVPPPTERRPEPVEAAPDPRPSPSGQESPSPSAAEPTPTAEVVRPGDDEPRPTEPGTPTAAASESPSTDPTPIATGSPTATATSTPTATPTPTPTSTPTTTPTATTAPEAPRPAAVTISGDTHRIEYADAPTYSGVVTDEEGAALAGVPVALQQREDEGWVRVASATTDQDGEVVLTAPPVYENTAMRLRTKGARSERWRVRVHPELTLTTAVDGDTVTIVASATGGRPGDVVSLTARRDGVRVTLGTGILGPDGTVTFQVQQETRKARYAGRLDATSEHTADRVVVRVVKPKEPDAGEATPSPTPRASSGMS